MNDPRCCTYKFELAETELTYPFEIDAPEEIPFGMDTAIRLINGETYDGDYVVIPKAFREQILETKNKVLYDDVTVREVPYFETHNDSGFTAYIASEV